MQECCEFLLTGYVNLSLKHTHTHTHTQNDGVESWQLGRSEQLVWGWPHISSQGCSSGEDDKWGKQIVKSELKREESFIKGIKSSIQLMVSGLERTLKINYSNIFISKNREKDEVEWLLQSYTEEKGLKFRSLALRDFSLLFHLAPPNLNMKQPQLLQNHASLVGGIKRKKDFNIYFFFFNKRKNI